MLVRTGRLADPDVVPPEGGWLGDDVDPFRVVRRPVDDGALDVPLRPEGLGALLDG